eukprot:SAG11_NODE_3372_length_2492_cov_1.366486_1_plen_66_part_00
MVQQVVLVYLDESGSGWDVDAVTSMGNMFAGSPLTCPARCCEHNFNGHNAVCSKVSLHGDVRGRP